MSRGQPTARLVGGPAPSDVGMSGVIRSPKMNSREKLGGRYLRPALFATSRRLTDLRPTQLPGDTKSAIGAGAIVTL